MRSATTPLDLLVPGPEHLPPDPAEVRLAALYDEDPGAGGWLRANFVSTVDGGAWGPDHLSGSINDDADWRVFRVLRALADVVLVGAGTVRTEGYGAMRLSTQAAAWRRAHGLAEQPVFALVSGRLDLDPASPVFTEAPVRPLVLTVGSAPAERRARLEEALGGAAAPVHLPPVTRDTALAREWLDLFEGAGLDGVISKPLDVTYQPNKRVMLKTKHERTADCVVAGFRWHKSGKVVGSLLLGLYNAEGRLQHVGVASSFTMKRRAELAEELAPLMVQEGEEHPWADWADASAHEKDRLPGGQSRWSAGKDLSFVPLRPERVVEVAYDHMEGTRFRHSGQFRRWRPDREPESCTYEQLEEPVR